MNKLIFSSKSLTSFNLVSRFIVLENENGDKIGYSIQKDTDDNVNYVCEVFVNNVFDIMFEEFKDEIIEELNDFTKKEYTGNETGNELYNLFSDVINFEGINFYTELCFEEYSDKELKEWLKKVINNN